MALAELSAELGIRSGRAVFARGTASSPISVASSSVVGSPFPSRASTPSPSPRHSSTASSPTPSSPSLPASPLPAAPSAPTTPSRSRAVPVYSPLAATANTPPRSAGRMYRVHPFFVRRAAPTPTKPRCVADYTSTSESGSSIGSSADSFGSPTPSYQPLDSPHSPLDRRNAAPMSTSTSAPIPASRALPSSSTAEEPQSRRAHQLAALLRARKAARTYAALNPSQSSEDIIEAMGSLDIHTHTSTASVVASLPLPKPPPKQRSPAADVFSDAGTTSKRAPQSAIPRSPSTSPRPTAPPRLENAYFSVSRPLPGHFDKPPTVVYTRDAGEADDLVACLQGPLGFDLEWPPPGIGPVLARTKKDGSVTHTRAGKWDAHAKKYVWPQGRTAVIQLADARTVVVYHLPSNGRIGPGMQAVLNDGQRVKTGVNIGNDGKKLWRDDLVPNTAGLLELSLAAHMVDPEIWTHSSRLISLARLTHHYIGVPLDKTEGIREGAWNDSLNAEQIEYAACDAYVGVLIYNALKRRADERGMTAEFAALVRQAETPQFPDAVVKQAQMARNHPAVVAATAAGAKSSQTQALGLFISGGSVPELATSLRISTRTVQNYVVSAAMLIPPDKYEGYAELAVRLVEAFPIDSYPAAGNAEFFKRLNRIAQSVDQAERVPVHEVREREWGEDE